MTSCSFTEYFTQESQCLSEVKIITEDIVSGHASVTRLDVEDSWPGFLVVAVVILVRSWLRLLWWCGRECWCWHWQSWWRAGCGGGRGQTGGEKWFRCRLVVVVEFDQRFVQWSDQSYLETVLCVSDHPDHVTVTAPLHILVTDTNKIVSLSHTSDL